MDIVNELRQASKLNFAINPDLVARAADEIERLRAALEAVVKWADDLQPYSDAGTELAPVFKMAREVLNGLYLGVCRFWLVKQVSYENVEVPFHTIGNRKVLTDRQIVEMPWLKEFIDRFPKCFERDELAQIWIFYPE